MLMSGRRGANSERRRAVARSDGFASILSRSDRRRVGGSPDRTAPRCVLVLALMGVLGGCSSAVQPTPSKATVPSNSVPASGAPASEVPAATGPTASGGAVVVEFEVANAERFKVELRDPADIAVAVALQAGERESAIPNGRIVYGAPGVNSGYSWHLDPTDFEFADLTTEVCDGRPSDVEAHRISGDRFCPWSAKIVDVTPLG